MSRFKAFGYWKLTIFMFGVLHLAGKYQATGLALCIFNKHGTILRRLETRPQYF